MAPEQRRRTKGLSLAKNAGVQTRAIRLDGRGAPDTPALKEKVRRDRRFESEGAEFLVLGQLLIRHIPAYKACTNLRGYDPTAMSARGKNLPGFKSRAEGQPMPIRFLSRKGVIQSWLFWLDLIVGMSLAGLISEVFRPSILNTIYCLAMRQALVVVRLVEQDSLAEVSL